MAGKTGTAQVNYGKKDGSSLYTSSFVGYFPADHQYSALL
jgi:cell division protein FtsI (penicillin-binding protein 3)